LDNACASPSSAKPGPTAKTFTMSPAATTGAPSVSCAQALTGSKRLRERATDGLLRVDQRRGGIFCQIDLGLHQVAGLQDAAG
jgi:hypothetical protein